ncbi:hypothetical protein VV11_015530 [Trichodesmium erythraeum 21-75]|nr:hypothetical protein [Trichodesmium erythraeum 21-75]
MPFPQKIPNGFYKAGDDEKDNRSILTLGICAVADSSRSDS